MRPDAGSPRHVGSLRRGSGAGLRFGGGSHRRLGAFRVARLVPGIGPAAARRVIDSMQAAADPLSALAAFVPPGSGRDDPRLGPVEAFVRRAACAEVALVDLRPHGGARV